MSRAIAALLLDMDGTMLDSERAMLDLYAMAAKKRGWIIDRAVAESTVGTTYQRTAEILLERYPGLPNEEILVDMGPLYQAMLKNGEVPVKPGLFELLDAARGQGIPIGVCSSSQREIVTQALQGCGALAYIGKMVCAGDAARSKPYPEPYRLLAERMGVLTGDCMAIEDSPHGLEAALAAEVGCVCAVPDFVPVPDALRGRVRVLDSLAEAIELLTQ